MPSRHPNDSEKPNLWGPPRLAEHVGVPVQTVYQWVHKRVGPPAIKVGRHLRFRPEDVEKWLESQEVGER